MGLEAAPGVLALGGVDRAVVLGKGGVDAAVAASDDAGVPSAWLQTGAYLCRFADARLAHVEEAVPEEPPPVAEGWGQQETRGGDLYEGQFVRGLRCGAGKCAYAPANGGGVYEGDWKNDKCDGDGVWRGPGRDAFGECVYDGRWRRGKREGAGAARYEDGGRFEGEYRDDFRYHGTWWLANGDVYVGYFGRRGRHGEGVCSYADTGEYSGAWVDDLRHGQGRMLYADGGVYVGAWHGGRRNGDGDMKFANRDVYAGKYVADVRCGRGRQTYASGAAYAGEWLDDMRHGPGVHEDEFGVYDGGWIKDSEEGLGTWTGAGRPDGETRYEGAWFRGDRHGAARSTYDDAAAFEGEFRDDSRFHGKLTETSGDVYEGGFHEHLRHGYGHQMYVDGGDYKGSWRAGVRWGSGDYENPFEKYSGDWARDRREGQGTWCGSRGGPPATAAEVFYEGEWQDDVRCGACASRDQDGAAFEGEYEADIRRKGVLKLANGDVYEGHFNANGRHGLGECTYASGGAFVGEWADDEPDTDRGKWVGVPMVDELATTYKSQSSRKGFFSKSPGRKYQIGSARVVPT